MGDGWKAWVRANTTPAATNLKTVDILSASNASVQVCMDLLPGAWALCGDLPAEGASWHPPRCLRLLTVKGKMSIPIRTERDDYMDAETAHVHPATSCAW